MSTVILTRDHIAQDFTVITNTYPQEQIVDPHYKKLFVSPDKRFILGCVGEFHPKEIDQPESYIIIEELLTAIINTKADKSGVFDLIDDDELVKKFLNLVDKKGNVFLITKDHRFMTYYSSKKEKMAFVHSQPIVGLGSGGNYGAGLLKGGMSIHEIWPHLHEMDSHTSLIYNAISLDILMPWEKLTVINDSDSSLEEAR